VFYTWESGKAAEAVFAAITQEGKGYRYHVTRSGTLPDLRAPAPITFCTWQLHMKPDSG
jgi:hypothetical protein